MSKYTKREINGKLGLGDSLSHKEKVKIIKDLFRRSNARTNLQHITEEELIEAKEMLDWCAAGMELYKSKKRHKRKYKKKRIVPKRKPRKKPATKKNTSNNNEGCLIPIAISLTSFGLLIWMLIP